MSERTAGVPSGARIQQPWYREPWPWILMAGPALVIVAGAVTVTLAVRSADGLVADDYYKQGLGINRIIAREERARALGLTAAVTFAAGGRVRITLGEGAPAPRVLRLALVHRTRAHEDRTITVARVGDREYEAPLEAPREGLWTLHLDDPSGEWRVSGSWRAGEASARLQGGAP